jgi:hypothetical protein
MKTMFGFVVGFAAGEDDERKATQNAAASAAKRGKVMKVNVVSGP